MPKMNFTRNLHMKFTSKWLSCGFFSMLEIPKLNHMHFITWNSHMLFMSTFSCEIHIPVDTIACLNVMSMMIHVLHVNW